MYHVQGVCFSVRPKLRLKPGFGSKSRWFLYNVHTLLSAGFFLSRSLNKYLQHFYLCVSCKSLKIFLFWFEIIFSILFSQKNSNSCLLQDQIGQRKVQNSNTTTETKILITPIWNIAPTLKVVPQIWETYNLPTKDPLRPRSHQLRKLKNGRSQQLN